MEQQLEDDCLKKENMFREGLKKLWKSGQADRFGGGEENHQNLMAKMMAKSIVQ